MHQAQLFTHLSIVPTGTNGETVRVGRAAPDRRSAVWWAYVWAFGGGWDNGRMPASDPSTPASASTDLADRYGARPRSRWTWWIVAAVGIGLGTAWAAWIAFQPRDVTAVMHSYGVRSDSEIVLTLEVRRNEAVPVECSIYAQSVDHAIVGETTVIIPPADTDVIRHEVPVDTTARAVTGVLRSCDVTE